MGLITTHRQLDVKDVEPYDESEVGRTLQGDNSNSRRGYWGQVSQNLTRFRQKVISDVLLGKGVGLTALQRYNLYPVVATCPPGRPRKKYGGKNTLGGFPDPVTIEDALKAKNIGEFQQRQRLADGEMG